MRLIDADPLKEKAFFHEIDNVSYVEEEDIDNAPTVDAVERKRGEWIEENRRPRSMMFYCSECHRTAYDPQNHHGGRKRCRYAYCQNCGAYMRGEEE